MPLAQLGIDERAIFGFDVLPSYGGMGILSFGQQLQASAFLTSPNSGGQCPDPTNVHRSIVITTIGGL